MIRTIVTAVQNCDCDALMEILTDMGYTIDKTTDWGWCKLIYVMRGDRGEIEPEDKQIVLTVKTELRDRYDPSH